MEVIRNRNAKELAARALETIFKNMGGSPVLFLSSGGSALNVLDGIDKKIFGQNFTIGVLDERFSPDPEVNNFLQLKNKLQSVDNVNLIDSVPLKDDTPEALAKRIEDSWRKWRSDNLTGKIIVTMGMGADGHTAGIFQSRFSTQPRTFSTERGRFGSRWMVGYDAGAASIFPLRVTATFGFLKSAVDFAIVYISGEEKRQALETVLADSGTLAETPARIFREMKKVRLFTTIII